eukprot:183571-Rhodomonas_salina.1
MRLDRVPWQLRLYFVTSIFLSPPVVFHLVYRRLVGREANLLQRLGLTAVRKPFDERTVWVHGASVGESLSALTLVRLLHAKDPSFRYVITSGSAAGQNILKSRLECSPVLRSAVVSQAAPLDLPFSVFYFLRQWKPSAFIILEAEIWPNTLWFCRQSGIPTILVDARMSPRSAQRWSQWPARQLIEFLLNGFRTVLCQSKENQHRLQELGAELPLSLGSIKVAAGPLPVDNQRLERIETALSECAGSRRTVWAASSTHEGEELLAAEAHEELLRDWLLVSKPLPPPPLLVIIPRHIHRGRHIADAIAKRHPSWSIALTSDGSSDEAALAAVDVVIADEMGTLGLWFEVAEVAFVGGSLVDGIGGHNVAEPGWFRCLPLHGPHCANSQHMVHALRELEPHGLIQVDGSCELARVLARLLKEDAASRSGGRGRRTACGSVEQEEGEEGGSGSELAQRQAAALRSVQ